MGQASGKLSLHPDLSEVRNELMHLLKRSCVVSGSLVLLLMVLAPAGGAAEPPHAWPPGQFSPLAPERIAALPPDQQPAWKAYWDTSQTLARSLPARSAPDFSPLKPIIGPGPGGVYSKGLRFDAARDWYASPAAAAVADEVVERQSKAGGWSKGNDYTKSGPESKSASHDIWSGGTFDNDATTGELRFLARVNDAAGEAPHAAAWRESILRGLRYLFNCQYPNGGVPQVYPLVGGYHDSITLNDGSMRRVLELFRDVSAGQAGFAFVPADLRTEAGRRLERGLGCLLATQLRGADGRRGIWSAQYDALTMRPSAARNFEPIAAVAWESAELVEFLMTLPRPSPEVVGAVDDAMAWFRRTPLKDMTWSRYTNDAQVVTVPGAPLMWARFYELNTDKPIFGDRDRTIHYAVSELSTERRSGYTWYGRWPSAALEQYDAWRKKIGGLAAPAGAPAPKP
jgi:PelA/Pel-15E family pectate lyase